ncbi:hypothetical protein BGZ98_010129 [Dissophora globulifera]|nr:hypothetical protein BGZ98_010129 [Dissophora globulifera]
MSTRVCDHFELSGNQDLVESARSLSVITDFDKHSCALYMQKYVDVLADEGVDYLLRKVIVDRGGLLSKHLDEKRLPAEVEIKDKVLEILALLGEKALEASKVMRKLQSEEYSDTSDVGRKVDCLFAMQGVELSNIEFKHQGATTRDLAIQNRKNVRLARCIQEAHTTYGVKDPSVLIADIFGKLKFFGVTNATPFRPLNRFVGVFYQVKPMDDIVIAGKVTSALVHLPRTAGELEAFLQDSSLAIIWNFMSYLETQGPKVIRAKDRFELAEKKMTLDGALSMTGRGNPPPRNRTFQHNVTLTPTKKRTWTMTIIS